ncbi:MAG: hypothetical protein ABSH53_00345 [Holophaga sp.]|jgi:hypothetical protein
MAAGAVSPVGTYRFLDLSGFIVSGKQAYSDLLREFDGFLVPEAEREFELIRIQGGIRDLENALVEDWSPIRADAALRRFQHLVVRAGDRSRFLAPGSWFRAIGWNYDDYFGGRFFDLAGRYLAALSLATWKTNWSQPRVDLCSHQLFWRKLANLAGFRGAMDFHTRLAGPEGFLEATRTFLETLLATRAQPDTHTIVTHNAFEPFNPARATRYFTHAKCIIVDRDPRDSFTGMAPHRHLALPVDPFIARFRLYHRQAAPKPGEEGLVLRARFEDLVLDYPAAVARVREFLGVEPAGCTRPGSHFQAARSAARVGLWKTHPDQDAIRRIRTELAEYCDPRVD